MNGEYNAARFSNRKFASNRNLGAEMLFFLFFFLFFLSPRSSVLRLSISLKEKT